MYRDFNQISNSLVKCNISAKMATIVGDVNNNGLLSTILCFPLNAAKHGECINFLVRPWVKLAINLAKKAKGIARKEMAYHNKKPESSPLTNSVTE